MKKKNLIKGRKGDLIVSRGARTAFVIAPANAPLRNSATSLVLKASCTATSNNS